MSIFAIGDIHGSFDALQTLFDQKFFSTSDTLVFLGDYVDKGPDTAGVLDFLMEISETYTCIFLRGNHEILMLQAQKNQRRLEEWLHFGGKETLQSYSREKNMATLSVIPESHWNFLEQTLPYYEYQNFIFVHAGLLPGRPLKEQLMHDLFWKKYLVPDLYMDDKLVICGHTARKDGRVADFGHTVCIDTYAHGGQWLTCFNPLSRVYLQTNMLLETRTGKLLSMVEEH